tara:strand:- start:113 stop:262 length:150 start_codon:yes stop_codon:yes gene_type:complete
MITHELAKIWITSDGKRFLDQEKAEEHEEKIQESINEIDKFEEVIKNWS